MWNVSATSASRTSGQAAVTVNPSLAAADAGADSPGVPVAAAVPTPWDGDRAAAGSFPLEQPLPSANAAAAAAAARATVISHRLCVPVEHPGTSFLTVPRTSVSPARLTGARC